MKHEIAQVSLRGNRSINQDRGLALTSGEGTILLALADGLGGHPKGDVAAQILMEVCRRLFGKAAKPVEEPERLLSAILHVAHLDIVDYGLAQDPVVEPHTTAVLALIQRGRLYWTHIGDSRLYLLRDGHVQIQTEDHSVVQQMRREGVISEAEMSHHPQRNSVTRTLGGPPSRLEVEPVRSTALQRNDVVLLCSDGVWGQMEEKQMTRIMSESNATLLRLTHILAHKAEALAFPESDNVTVVSLRWGEGRVAEGVHEMHREAVPRDEIEFLRRSLELEPPGSCNPESQR